MTSTPPMQGMKRAPFFLGGVVLFALKVALDYGLATVFGESYSPLDYISPRDAPLLQPEGRLGYWLAMWAVALPFIGGGVWLIARRLIDARMPAWLAVLFFVPFANILFFLLVAAVPTDAFDRDPTLPAPPTRSRGMAILVGAVAGAIVALGMVGVSVGLLGRYGSALFIGAPTASGFVAALVYMRLHGSGVLGSLAAALFSLILSAVIMLAFAIEGAVCLAMASPLALVAAITGWGIATAIQRWKVHAEQGAPVAFALLPIWLGVEAIVPSPPPEHVVESVVEVDASPAEVWQQVIAFPDLPPATELVFRAGVASPTGATLSGEGVGAVRRCRFTTGEFVEPITAWEPGHELSFDVVEQPDPMREMTPYEGARPPHLDGYFRTTRGQFLLEARADGGTRLRGRTYYELDVFPQAYWSILADGLIHTIHLRVLEHVKHLAER